LMNGCDFSASGKKVNAAPLRELAANREPGDLSSRFRQKS